MLVALFILLVCIVQLHAQQPQQDRCNGFRITSPTKKNLHWTAAQCYQVSYDLGGFLLETNNTKKVSVDLYNSARNEKVSTLVTEEPVNAFGGTNAFNLNIGTHSSGMYYYSVSLISGGTKCEPKRSVDFQVTLNPNSPPAKC